MMEMETDVFGVYSQGPILVGTNLIISLAPYSGLWPEPETKLILAAGVNSHLTTEARDHNGATVQ